MIVSSQRLKHRLQQFWGALFAAPRPRQLARAQRLLTIRQMDLFHQLQPSEQAHALKVMEQLLVAGHTQHDLLVAALLHDVGKAQHKLCLWQRVCIVLLRAIFPKKAKMWGQGLPRGWKRPLVVAEQHPAWGAAAASAVGASTMTANLIRRHQESDSLDLAQLEDRLLLALRIADQQS